MRLRLKLRRELASSDYGMAKQVVEERREGMERRSDR
jgi:hypothetical protein